jgi:zinc finger-like protein
MDGRSSANMVENCVDHSQVQCSPSPLAHQIGKINCACESTVSGKRKYSAAILDVPETIGSHPIDEILLWHNAIKKELNEIAVETRKIQHSGDYTNLSAFNERLQFIAEVFIFHRYHLNLFFYNSLSCEASYISSIKHFLFHFFEGLYLFCLFST